MVQKKHSGKPANSPRTPTPSVETPRVPRTNPLINEADRDRVRHDAEKKQGKPLKKYRFNYQLDESLKRPSTRLFPPAVHAATCNIDTAPFDLPIYTLQAHWKAEEAKKIAINYGITSSTYSQPAEGPTFHYFFTDDDAKSAFRLLESSGLSDFHVATGATPSGTLIGLVDAQAKATSELKKHGLDEGLTPKPAQSNATSYIFDYKKSLHPALKLADQVAVRTTAAGSLCSLGDSVTINTLEVHVRKDGVLQKLINNSRKIKSTKTVSRQSLEAAVEEVEGEPIDTFVIPEEASTPTTGTVTIDDAVLAYYDDLSFLYPQTAYVPVYITRGELPGSGVTVFTVFSAVGKEALTDAGVFEEVPGIASKKDDLTQKQDTLKVPPPPPPPPAGTGGTGQCWGNQVDYLISCAANGSAICQEFIAVTPDKDPLNICEEGTKSIEGTISDVPEGKSACQAFMEEKNLPYTPTQFYGTYQSGSSSGAGPFTCTINATPC